MIIDGEKWACESCVRGHRVSNCSHSDRPLQHINKKGRPVSQCQHCRTLRRSKSAHVKCDCGEKTSKCVHLQPSLEGHRDSCCCNHGGRCTCSHKKDLPQLDTVPESDSDQEKSPCSSTVVSRTVRNRRSRASTQNSDGMLCFDEHGHHKPTYKHAKPHQKSGPYQLNRGHSNQSSMEDLGDDSSPASTGNMPQPEDQRLTKSEAASPLMRGTSSAAPSIPSLPPLDINAAVQSWPYSGSEMFADETDQPMISASLSCPSVDWGNLGFGFGPKDMDNFAHSNYSQAPSFFEPQSALPSGEVSEVDDLGHSAGEEFDPVGTFSRNSTDSTGFNFRPSQENLAAAVGLSTEDFDFVKLEKEVDTNKYYDSTASLVADDSVLVTAITPGFAQDEMFWALSQQDRDGDFSVPPLGGISDASDPSFWTTA